MYTTRISLGFTINAVVLLASSRRLIFGGPVNFSRVNWKEFVRCQVRANGTYSEARRRFRVKNGYSQEYPGPLISGGSTLKSAVFRLSSSLPSLIGGGGGLVSDSVGKADLLSDYFDGKQPRESVDLPLTCHLSPSLIAFAFRSIEVRRLLLD